MHKTPYKSRPERGLYDRVQPEKSAGVKIKWVNEVNAAGYPTHRNGQLTGVSVYEAKLSTARERESGGCLWENREADCEL
jgi:hypothetical protein